MSGLLPSIAINLTVKTTTYHLKFYCTISVAGIIWPAHTKAYSKAHQTVWVYHAPVTATVWQLLGGRILKQDEKQEGYFKAN